MNTPKFEIKDREVFRNGEKIGFFNDPDNHFQATRGNAQFREEFIAWQEKQPGADTILGNEPPAVDPTNEPSEPIVETPKADPVIPTHDGDDEDPFPKVTAPPIIPEDRLPVPDKEPQIRPGIGIFEPNYLWWAWNQDDATFKAIYKKDKSEFRKDHGGYLDKVTASLGKGAYL